MVFTSSTPIDDRASLNKAIESTKLEKADIEGIRNTTAVLARYTQEKSRPLFDAETQCILAVPKPFETTPLSSFDFLKDLLSKAQAGAVSLSCSSILAGRSSDSDEFSDVAFYAGDLEDEGRVEESTISKLGLSNLLEVGEIIPVKTDANTLAAVSAIPQKDVEACSNEISLFNQALSKLDSRLEFTVELPGDEEGHVIHFVVGKYEEKWCGLTTASIQLE
ncbi:uncharacterized protein EI90DRAFT_3074284 [Cantharellus anzutake]|uniref:uncharacterized protein n=1 Tax=Cantharellus anzutake TaxID=1750568 RepID=UPI001907DBFB|nr:uncharacterized protein EI90DRAFT_3081659 [Cantharellus anzutake]XP_038911882.1 uncharacterized protein EI90DRAFT_3074284 [Cantharellus anzutake]KAF8319854.1 hypothetical protein EI90DRAFT_3081659 [Cantharellus anzutake]KAF8324886.1 hypothetical protein EI90DRAFT_3074284 [Cantharellus anzutake]